MSDLLFIEDRFEAARAPSVLSAARNTTIVALTAEALDGAETAGVACEPVSRFGGTHGLAAADDRFNADCAELAAACDAAVNPETAGDPEGGPLAGQTYYLQYAISAIAKRCALMRDTIASLRPERVYRFARPVDPWFAGDGYAEDPWFAAMPGAVADWPRLVSVIPPTADRAAARPPGDNIRDTVDRARRAWLRRRARAAAFVRDRLAAGTTSPTAANFGRKRLLFVGSFLYDWEPVAAALHAAGGGAFQVTGEWLDGIYWTFAFHPRLTRIGESGSVIFDVPPARPDAAEVVKRVDRFDRWAAEARPRLEVLGIDVWPGLRTHMRAIAARSTALARHADAISDRLLDSARPDAVCFPAIANLVDKRLARAARTRGVPVLCYQHGFGYGIQVQAKDEQIETIAADFFLTYGPAIQPRLDGPFHPRARYVGVGSTRLEALFRQARPKPASPRPPTILWVAESSTRNTHVTSLTEDTLRYALERRCLERLSGSGKLRVVFRPYVHCIEFDGITQWLRRRRLPSIRIDAVTPMYELIRACDVAVVLTSSPTTWGEVVAHQRPMVLFCDPRQTLLTPSFVPRLAATSLWCRSPKELFDAVDALSVDPAAAIAHLGTLDTGAFVRDYLVGEADGRCLDRIGRLLESLPRCDYGTQ